MGTLTTRALNRALLARQLLLERTEMPVSEALEHLVGLQAQNPRDPYLSLWARSEAFDPERLSELLANRRAVRISLMRSTIHLVTARDALAIRPVLQRWLERNLYKATPFGRQIEGIDLEALTAAGREQLDAPGAPLPDGDTPAPVRFLPDYDNVLLAHADRSRILPEGARARDVIGRPTALVDGFVAAFWKLERRTGAITVGPLRKLTASERRDVVAEAELLLERLLAPGAPAKPVQLE